MIREDGLVVLALTSKPRSCFETELALTDNRAETRFTAAGPLGAHYIYLFWPNGEPGHRMPNEVPYASWGMAK